MEIGITRDETFAVTHDMLASAAGSGTADVFATPVMIAKMEGTATRSVMPFLDAGKTTVGVHVDVKHLDATPEGMHVTIRTELTEISENGKFLTFKVTAHDEKGLIGEGVHVRAIINEARFMEKVRAKIQAAK